MTTGPAETTHSHISHPQDKHLKHPVGLWWLSAVYVLAALSFGIINSLLVLYLRDVLHIDPHRAYTLFATFNALIFVVPIAAGFLSEKFGYKPATGVGILFCVVGALLPGSHSTTLLYFGLAIFATGMAICATTSYCIVDFFYAKQDIRRESGFTLFYLIFNIGFFSSSIIGAYLSTHISYRAAFHVAGASDILALILFVLSSPVFRAYPGRTLKAQIQLSPITNTLLFAIIATVIALGASMLFAHTAITHAGLWAIIGFTVMGLLVMVYRQPTKRASLKLIAFLILTAVSTSFWSLYMLEPSLLTVFIQHNVDRTVLGFTIPPSTFYGLDPFYVATVGLLFSWLWRYLGRNNKDLSLSVKFGSSLVSMGFGFIVFILGIHYAESTHLVSLSWVVSGYLFLTIAELLISPIGLAMVGRLAPHGREGILMGVWQLSIGASAILSGYLANMAVIPKGMTLVQSNAVYFKTLGHIGLVVILIGAAVLLCSRYIEKLM